MSVKGRLLLLQPGPHTGEADGWSSDWGRGAVRTLLAAPNFPLGLGSRQPALRDSPINQHLPTIPSGGLENSK